MVMKPGKVFYWMLFLTILWYDPAQNLAIYERLLTLNVNVCCHINNQ